MNSEQVLCAVEEAIKNRPASPCKTYHICLWQGKVVCMPKNHTHEEHEVFMICTENLLSTGFDTHQWDNLLYKIVEHIKEIS